MGEYAPPSFEVEKVLNQLTLDEKVALLSGTDFWHTASIPRLNIPAIRVSDGPNGVRGTKFFNGVPAACFPCGTALGATWNTELLREGGILQAKEAIAKGASAILGPTVNIQRTPLGGRGFESYSEDPVLSGTLAAATINGIQSQRVMATIKHFVCNDQEEDRRAVSNIVTDRALREVYLKPFQIAQRDAQPASYMTAYNKVNGLHCSETKDLLQGILRDEWQFDGLVMSDWFGTYSTIEAIKAGLDLEMPGPTVFRGEMIKAATGSGKLSIHEINACVRRVLQFVERAMHLGLPEYAEEGELNTSETSQTLRKIAGESIVLMKNEDHLLPLKPTKTTAVIGPNAALSAYCGGGSAALDAYYTVTPFEGISSKSEHVKYTLGAPGYKSLPLLSEMTRTKSGKMGLDMTIYLENHTCETREAIDHIHVRKSDVLLIDYSHSKLEGNLFYADVTGTFTPDVAGIYDFSVAVAGTAKLYVDGQLVIDNETKQTRGGSFFSTGTREEKGNLTLEAGKTYNVRATFGSDPTSKMERSGVTGLGGGGLRLGATRRIDQQEELEKARQLASEVDQVVLCIGLNSEWESEGYDRPDMNLPPYTNELVQLVAAANPETVVVIQSGTPVEMPWINDVKAVVHAWYGGNECGNAIADVIFGDVNPSGKLPLSFPKRVQDNPAYLNARSNRNRVLYGEDVFVGYKYYEAVEREPLYPFGHGLSYTTFSFEHPVQVVSEGEDLVISTTVKNTGTIDGAQVVQVYVKQHNPSIQRPVKELKAFTKVFVKAGESVTAECRVSKKEATSWWDEDADAWISEKDTYSVLVGDSSANTPLQAAFEIAETSWWRGL